MALLESTREALLKVATSTLTGALNRRGLRNMFLQDVSPPTASNSRKVEMSARRVGM